MNNKKHILFAASFFCLLFSYIQIIKSKTYTEEDINRVIQEVYVSSLNQYLLRPTNNQILTQQERQVLNDYRIKEDDECSICSVELTKDPDPDEPGNLLSFHIAQGNTPHIFHKKCLRQWFEQSRTCPICREGAQFLTATLEPEPFQTPVQIIEYEDLKSFLLQPHKNLGIPELRELKYNISEQLLNQPEELKNVIKETLKQLALKCIQLDLDINNQNVASLFNDYVKDKTPLIKDIINNKKEAFYVWVNQNLETIQDEEIKRQIFKKILTHEITQFDNWMQEELPRINLTLPKLIELIRLVINKERENFYPWVIQKIIDNQMENLYNWAIKTIIDNQMEIFYPWVIQ